MRRLRNDKELYNEHLKIGPGTQDKCQYISYDAHSRAVHAHDTMSHVCLEPLLIIQSDLLRQTLLTELDKFKVGLLHDFTDTLSYRCNTVCSKQTRALILHFFVDTFEASNEFGSHTAVLRLDYEMPL